jgi:hypothetical protein
MTPHLVTVRDAVGREREVRVVATTEQSACTQAILRVERETGRKDWQAVKVLPA